jgi:hypothetical protein
MKKKKSDTCSDSGNTNHIHLTKYLNNMTGKDDIKELQKTVIVDTARVYREVLCKSTKRLSWKIRLRVTQAGTTK